MNPESFLVPVYLAYALATLALTVFLARTLFKNGAVFLEGVFRDEPRLAEAVNRLLVVGFYLLNLGYAAVIMKADGAETAVAGAEVLAWKLGALLLSLGVVHFANLYLFYRIRRRSRIAVLPPPVAPQWSVGLDAPHAMAREALSPHAG